MSKLPAGRKDNFINMKHGHANATKMRIILLDEYMKAEKKRQNKKVTYEGLTQREEVKPRKECTNSSKRNTKASCFKCGKIGHKAVACQNG